MSKEISDLYIKLSDASNAKKGITENKYPYDIQNEQPIIPKLIFYDNYEKLNLRQGDDYDIQIKNNDKVGIAEITITGKGNYVGEQKIQFSIIADLKNAELELTNDVFNYVGFGVIPEPLNKQKIKSINIKGLNLTNDDYLVFESSENNYIKSGTIIVTPNITNENSMSRFLIGSISKTYSTTINPDRIIVKDIGKSEGFPDYEYTGKEIKPDYQLLYKIDNGENANVIDVTNYYDNKKIKFFKITSEGNIPVENLIEKGDYIAEIVISENIRALKINFAIGKAKIRERDVTFIRKYTYDGYAKKPYLSVRRGRKTLQEGKDYKVRCENYKGEETEVKNCGEYYPVIEGLGEYKNTLLKFRLLEKPRCIEVVPTAVHNLNLSKINSGLKYLNWNTIDKIDGVKIKVKEKGKTGFKEYTTANTSYMLSGLEGGKTYEIQVIPYVRGNNKNYYGYAARLIETIDNAVKKENNYPSYSMDIFKSTSYSGKYTRAAICPGSNKKYEDDRVKAGRTYYYKVRRLRADGEDETTCGPFSEPKKAIVEENGCTLKWDTSNDINNNNFDIYT